MLFLSFFSDLSRGEIMKPGMNLIHLNDLLSVSRLQAEQLVT